MLGRFAVVAGEIKKIVPARFLMPADLDKARKWFMRGRVQAFGVDLVTPFVPIV